MEGKKKGGVSLEGDFVNRRPDEGILDYYKRLRQSVAAGLVELEKSEIYNLLYQEEVSADHARKALRVLDLTIEADLGLPPLRAESAGGSYIPNKSTLELNKDGSQSSSKLINMSEGDSKNAVFLLEAHGYDPEVWEITSAKSSIWDSRVKNSTPQTLYSSRITVKPKIDSLDFNKIIRHFEDFSKSYTFQEVAPKQYEYGAELLVPCFFDVHFAKLADVDECGEKYDYKIAKERFIGSIRRYISRFAGRKFEKIVFVVGNDFFNSESNGMTVNDTRQDNDSRYSKMFNKGCEALIEGIDLLAAVAPVTVLLVQGNHSFYTEFYAACMLQAWYRDSQMVTVDNSPMVRKYLRFGKNLLGFTHGSEEKDRIFGLMQYEAAEDWGLTTTREWLVGHFHSEGVMEKNGVVVRRIPSLTGLDAWLMKQGYTMAKKRTAAFIYDKENGLTETHYVNL